MNKEGEYSTTTTKKRVRINTLYTHEEIKDLNLNLTKMVVRIPIDQAEIINSKIEQENNKKKHLQSFV